MKYITTIFLAIITLNIASCGKTKTPTDNSDDFWNSFDGVPISDGGNSSDSVGDTRSAARSISLSSSGTGSYSSSIDDSSDNDYYSFRVSTAGTYMISTSGSTDTMGALYNSGGSRIGSNDDGGSGNNFNISQNLSTGTYYINVTGHSSDTGGYTINISRTGGSNDNEGSGGTDPGARGEISWTLTWSYSGSEITEGPDIDLWVKTPSGETISGVNKSGSGFALDIDDRGGFGSGNGGGPERIYSTSSSVTLGTYEYGVRWFGGNSGYVNYSIRLYYDGTLAGSDSGQMSSPSSTPGSLVKVTEVNVN
jgi:hypothetical protein